MQPFLLRQKAHWYTMSMKIGDKIIALRKEKGWSQVQFAKKMGISLSAFGRWERNENLPDAGDVRKMAEFFGVTTDYLLFDDAPKDGSIHIGNPQLMKLFEEVSKLDEHAQALVSELLESYVLKKKLQRELVSTGKS